MPEGQFHNYMTHTDHNTAVELINGRWWIKMGFAGFNCPANNGFGFASKSDAECAIRRYNNRTPRLSK